MELEVCPSWHRVEGLLMQSNTQFHTYWQSGIIYFYSILLMFIYTECMLVLSVGWKLLHVSAQSPLQQKQTQPWGVTGDTRFIKQGQTREQKTTVYKNDVSIHASSVSAVKHSHITALHTKPFLISFAHLSAKCWLLLDVSIPFFPPFSIQDYSF